MMWLLLWLLPIVPTAECLAQYDDQWCWDHAHQLAAAKPVFADLATDQVGGYRVGDAVPISGPRDHAVIGEEDVPYLKAVARFVLPSDQNWVMLMTAGESEFDQYADHGGPNGGTTAGGYVQALKMWERVVGCSRFEAECSARIAAHLLANGGRGHWQYQP